jgi:hypothetical protein
MNPDEMHPDMPPDAFEWINHMDSSSNMTVLGTKLWWMITARHILRRWPSKAAIHEQLVLRRAEMHEDLRIHVARRRLGGDQ